MRFGGLGICRAAQVAFLAFIHASSSLVGVTVPSCLSSFPPLFLDEAKSLWAQSNDHLPPVSSGACRLKSLDGIKAVAMATQLLEEALLMLIKLVSSQWPLKKLGA